MPQPRIASVPDYVGSLGEEVADRTAEAGLILDGWQRWSLVQALGFRRDGKWSAFEVGLEVPRQDGKGGILEARIIGGLFVLEEQLITYTAHLFKTAQEHFLRISSLLRRCPSLMRQVKQIREAHGDEGIELKSGQRLRFLARSGGSGRGFSGDVVILDEAMKLPVEAMGALVPTMAARHNVTVGGPQLWYAGSGGLEESHVWEGVRGRAIAGDDPNLCFIGYEAGDPDDHEGKFVDFDDRAEWYAANPAMHGDSPRITEEFVEKERRTLTDEQFGRERLCVWGGHRRAGVIQPEVWHHLTDKKSKPRDPIALAVDVPPEEDCAAIAVAGLNASGRCHVELVEGKLDSGQLLYPGTDWVAGRLAELVGKWKPCGVALDPSAPAGGLLEQIREAFGQKRLDVELDLVSGRSMAQACSALYQDAVVNRALAHLGQPELNAAVDAGRKRVVGDAWVWHRRDTASNIAPLVAVTLARYELAKHGWVARKKSTTVKRLR